MPCRCRAPQFPFPPSQVILAYFGQVQHLATDLCWLHIGVTCMGSHYTDMSSHALTVCITLFFQLGLDGLPGSRVLSKRVVCSIAIKRIVV